MTTTDIAATGRGEWAPTVFETKEWLTAWSRSTVERARVLGTGGPPLFLLEYSPFWHGYEIDTEMDPVWDRPVVTVGSLYAGYGPAYLAESAETIRETTENARALAAEHGACGTLVLNLPTPAPREWAASGCPPRWLRPAAWLRPPAWPTPARTFRPAAGLIPPRFRPEAWLRPAA